MEKYQLIASWVGWPAITAIMILVIPAIIWLFNKNITSLRDENRFLKTRLDEEKIYSVDATLHRVLTRFKLANEELEELKIDKLTNSQLIIDKNEEIESLQTQIDFLEELSSNFICPYCGAVQVSHEYHPIWGEYDGREIEDEIEYSTYECGLSIKDSKVIHPCRNVNEDNKVKR